MRDRSFLKAPKIVSVSFGVEPAFNAIESLQALTITHKLSGMGEWVDRTASQLPPDMVHDQRLMFQGLQDLFYGVFPAQNWSSFLAYVDTIASLDPVELRDSMIEKLREIPYDWGEPEAVPQQAPDAAELLHDPQVYMQWINVVWGEHPAEPEIDLEAFALRNDPPALQKFIVSHLRRMWYEVLQPEWDRSLPLLQESVAAFQQFDYSGLTIYEAIRAVTGRDLRGYWQRPLEQVDHVIFVPSAHSGPYVTKFVSGSTLRLLFQARLPKGAKAESSALSRSELLVRLNALADDTRLRILELLSEEELCAQDIITRLDLSQSSVSRHLSQLSATGYITERRRDVAKCYSLNPERIEETFLAIQRFLKKKQPSP